MAAATAGAVERPDDNDRVVIITGGAQGLGAAIAERLGKRGCKIMLMDRNAAQLEEARGSLAAAGVEHVSAAAADVTKQEDWARVVAATVEAYGRVDMLVQSAGITGVTGVKTAEVDPDNFKLVMDVNTTGVFLGCRAVLPQFTARKYGRIVNIASIAGKEGNAGMLAYSTSKAAVIGLTKVIGKEYAQVGDITCNALAPAVVRTAMVEAMPEAQVKYMTDKIPMRRCGTLQEIAAMADFMGSADTSFTTGFTFDATGGRATY